MAGQDSSTTDAMLERWSAGEAGHLGCGVGNKGGVWDGIWQLGATTAARTAHLLWSTKEVAVNRGVAPAQTRSLENIHPVGLHGEALQPARQPDFTALRRDEHDKRDAGAQQDGPMYQT